LDVPVLKGNWSTSIRGRFTVLLPPFIRYAAFTMFQSSANKLHPFVIACKGCRKNIPAPVQTMPASWFILRVTHNPLTTLQFDEWVERNKETREKWAPDLQKYVASLSAVN
jgi:hypothetical protein